LGVDANKIIASRIGARNAHACQAISTDGVDTTELDFLDFPGDGDDGGRRVIDYSELVDKDDGGKSKERTGLSTSLAQTPHFRLTSKISRKTEPRNAETRFVPL
jgi:hypothetical protein